MLTTSCWLFSRHSFVNGSEAQFIQQLAAYKQRHSQGVDAKSLKDITGDFRFNSERNELMYSLRSVVQHMNWVRHIYIVTSGQVPLWLDVTNPRITIVPHTTIFANASHLPTFNSNAIEANLHRIPGLSEIFLYLNDDMMLMKPTSLADFVTDKGELVMYYDWQFSQCRRDDTDKCSAPAWLFESVLRYTDWLYTQHFNDARPRYSIAHTAYLMSKSWLDVAQSGPLAQHWQATSSHQLRHAQDMQYTFAMHYYLLHMHNAYVVGDVTQQATWFSIDLKKTVQQMRAELLAKFRTPRWKTIVIQDNIDQPGAAADQMNAAVSGVMQELFPYPAEWELNQADRHTECKWLNTQYGQLPTRQQMIDACR